MSEQSHRREKTDEDNSDYEAGLPLLKLDSQSSHPIKVEVKINGK